MTEMDEQLTGTNQEMPLPQADLERVDGGRSPGSASGH